jgi:hypothetical protein
MSDRATGVTRTLIEILVAALREEGLRHRLEDLLREEFADEKRLAIADRRLDDNA